jgi:hypothetical protein
MSQTNTPQTNTASTASTAFWTIVALLFVPFSIWMQSSVMLQTYNWFLAPYPSFPALTLLNFVGVSILFSMFVIGFHKGKPDDEKYSEYLVSLILRSFFYNGVFYATGWVLYKMLQ